MENLNNQLNPNDLIKIQPSKSHRQSKIDDNINWEMGFQKVVNLDCGSTLIKTSLGYIQFGMPPGALTEMLGKNIEIPQYFIIPSVRFHKQYAVNLADFHQIALYNYINNNCYTHIICTHFASENLKKVFNHCYKEFCQKDFHPILDFYTSIDKNPIPDFKKERQFIFKLFDDYVPDIQFEDMLDFIIFDKSDRIKTQIKLPEGVIIKVKGSDYHVYENQDELGVFKDKIELNYVIDVNWDSELEQKYQIDDLLEKGKSYKGIKTANNTSRNVEQQPKFGITFLPKQQVSNNYESSLGFIIWINGRGAVVDPPPFTSQILKKLHISQVLIEWIIITQANPRNDQGAFQLLFENSNLELITTRQIYDQFLLKYSLLSSMSRDFLEKIIKFRPVCIGAPLTIKNCQFKFFYNIGIIPNIGFTALCEKQLFYFVGDTLFDFEQLELAKKQGVINEDRYKQLTFNNWKNANMIVLYVGKQPWNTNLEKLNNMSFITPEIKKKLYLITRDDSLYEQIEKLGFSFPNNNIFTNQTIKLTDPKQKQHKHINVEKVKQQELQEKVDLLCTIEIFENISIKNFRDLLQSAKEEYFRPGEFIIKQGSVGTKFYFVMSGIVCIYTNNRALVRYCGTGAYFGEKALNQGIETRGANVIAAQESYVVSLEKQDFWFIFGEDRDDAAPITEKLLSIQQSRQKDTVNLIRMNRILKDFSESQRQELEMILKETKFETNKIIWTKGQPAKFAIIIKSGSIKFSDCPEQNKPEMGEGFFIGEIDALLNDGPQGKLTTTLISLKPTEALLIDKMHLIHFFKKNLGILLKLNYLKYFGPESEDIQKD